MSNFELNKGDHTVVVEHTSDVDGINEMLQSAFEGVVVKTSKRIDGTEVPITVDLSVGCDLATVVYNIVDRFEKNEYNNNKMRAAKKGESEHAYLQAQQRHDMEIARLADTGISRTFADYAPRSGSEQSAAKKKQQEDAALWRTIKYLAERKKAGTITEAEEKQRVSLLEEIGVM